jgi:hypothetical protein
MGKKVKKAKKAKKKAGSFKKREEKAVKEEVCSGSNHHEDCNDTLKVLNVVKCHDTDEFTLISDCKSCEHHDNMRCGISKSSIKVEIISNTTPHKVNRAFSKNTSKSLHETILNYYTYTDVCREVQDIRDPSYVKFRKRFMKGEFHTPNPEHVKPFKIDEFTPEIHFECSKDGEWVFNGRGYTMVTSDKECTDPINTIENTYYLYEMLGNDGLGDLMVGSSSYCLRSKPIEDYREDKVLVIHDKGAVIGSVKNV